MLKRKLNPITQTWSLGISRISMCLQYWVWALSLFAITQNSLGIVLKLCTWMLWLLWGDALRHAHQHKRVVSLQHGQQWSWQQIDGHSHSGHLLPIQTVVWRWAVIFAMRSSVDRRRHFFMVTRDQLTRVKFKALVRVVRKMA